MTSSPKVSRRLVAAAAAALAVAAPVLAMADTYPSRPVRLIVPFTAGGTMDPPVRILANALSRAAGQQFIVDNRPGAGGIVGSGEAARTPGDGYNVLVTSSALPIAQLLYRNPTYDSIKSYRHIAIFADLPTVLAINSERLKVRNLAELVAYAKSHPGKLSYGSPGSGTTSHLAAEVLKDRLGLDIVHVPYRGAAQAVTAALSKEIDLIFVGQSSVTQQVKAGKLQALTVSTGTRSPQLPDVPTTGELPAAAGYDVPTWLGLAVPASTPDAVVERLTSLVRHAMNEAHVKQQLADAAVLPVFKDGEMTTKQIGRELAVYGDLMRKLNVRAD